MTTITIKIKNRAEEKGEEYELKGKNAFNDAINIIVEKYGVRNVIRT